MSDTEKTGDKATNLKQQTREFFTAERLAYFERWRLHVEPFEADRKAWIRYAVEYAQMAIRTGFLLNGGALIAVPAFAKFLGDGLWVRGSVWPKLMIVLFVIGMVLFTLATILAFFAMIKYSHQQEEGRERMAKLVSHDYEVSIGGSPKTKRSDFEEMGTKEKRYWKQGHRRELASICAALLGFAVFTIGAVIAVYIISGKP